MKIWNKFKNKNNENDYIENEEMYEEEEAVDNKGSEMGYADNIVPFANKNKGANKGNTTVIVVKPVSFDDAQQVADYVKNYKSVVVNFENTDTVVGKRIVDFMLGTAYALGGKFIRVGKNVFMCSPSNVSIEGEEQNDLSVKAPINPWEEK